MERNAGSDNAPTSRVTMKDVARMAGVSQSTVSFVLNGQQEMRISARTRKAVLEAAETLGYRPRAAGRPVSTYHTRVLGLMIDETLPVPGEPEKPQEVSRLKSTRTVQRISRMVDTMTGSSDRQMIRLYSKKICRLPSKGYGTLEFDLEGQRLENFLQSGRDAMTAHLEGRGLLTGGR